MIGAIVVAPPGSGKSTWIASNKSTEWIEGDDLYPQCFKQKERGIEDMKLLDDLNGVFKKHGYKVITGDWYTLENVDAIVLPRHDVLEKRMAGRERPGHNVAEASRLLLSFREKATHEIPLFDTVGEAIMYVSENEKNVAEGGDDI